MAKVRFIGNEPHEIKGPVNRVVDPDELVDVDDNAFADYGWPESLWTVVADPQSKSTAKTKE